MKVKTFFKVLPIRDDKYKAWIKKQKCVNCPKPADDPHHVKIPFHGGIATTPGDDRCIPVCRECHDLFERDRAQLNRLNPEALILRLNQAYAASAGRAVGEKKINGRMAK